MIFRPYMTWSEKYLKWGFWTPEKPVVDCSKWHLGAQRNMAMNVWTK